MSTVQLDYVLSPFYPVADKTDVSHRAGWARYWAHATGAILLTTKTMAHLASVKRGQTVGVYHGMEFKGQLNLQSGLTEAIRQRVDYMLAAKRRGVKFVSLDQPMPDYGQLLAERGLDGEKAGALTKLCKTAGRALVPTERPSRIVIGDSHSLSQYERRGEVILREDGQTLYGVVGPDRPGMAKYLDDKIWELGIETDQLEVISFYFGNIDIRHHLFREQDPVKATTELVKRYVSQVSAIDLASNCNEIVLPLPIEHPSRQIPKSGWYKGAPFAGRWEDRTKIQKHMVRRLREECRRHGVSVIDHPKHFTNKQGELAFEVMEKPRSVHIAPAEYVIAQVGGEQWKS